MLQTIYTCNKILPLVVEAVISTKNKRNLQLLPAAGPFKVVSIDKLGPFPKTTSNYQHVVIMIDLYSILTRAGSIQNGTSTHLSTNCLDNEILRLVFHIMY